MPNGQFPTILAGGNLTAALLQLLAIPWARKDADTPRSNVTAVSSDPDLQFPVVANGIYHVFGWVSATGATLGSADLKCTFSGSATTTGEWTVLGLATGSTTVNINAVRAVAGANAVGINGGTQTPAFIWGTFQVGATPGTLAFSWAQNTSNATPTTLKAGSMLFALRSA